MTEAPRPFYVRRGNKVGRLLPAELLSARRKARLSPTDEIRRSGIKQWQLVEDFDWDGLVLECQAKQAIAGREHRSSDKPKPLQAIEPASEKVTWWSEESASHNVRRNLNPRRLVAIAGVAIASVAVMAWLWSSYVRDSNGRIMAGGNATELVQDVETVSLDSQGADIALDPTENATDIAANAEASKSTELLGTERPIPIADISNAESLDAASTGMPIGDVQPVNSASMSAASTAKPPQPTLDSSTAFSDLNRAALGNENSESAAESMDAKSELDRLFDKTAAIIEFHMRNTQAFQKGQTEWHELSKSLADLQAFVSSGTIQASTLAERQAALQVSLNECAYQLKYSSTLLTTPILREQVLGQANALNQEVNLVNGKLRELQTVLPIRAEELVKANERKRALEVNFQLWAGQEYESIRNLMDDIDFFGEMPIAYHQRIIAHCSTLLASQPDFLLGYLLHGFSALHTGNTLEVEKDQQALQRQMSSLVPDISSLRNGLLNRYAAMSLAMLAASQAKSDQRKLALKTMKSATERDLAFVEGWLMRGSLLAASGDPIGATEFFQRAIKLQPEDPRVYRIAAKELFDAKSTAINPLRNYVQELVRRIGSNDWQSWAVASRVSAGLGDLELAERYFSSITRTPLNASQVDELAAYLKQNAAH